MKQVFFIERGIFLSLLVTCSLFAVDKNEIWPVSQDKAALGQQVIKEEEFSVVLHVIEHMLARLAENNEEPTESLLRLYQAVTENGEVKIEDLNELLPVMVECMKAEQERAARPDAPDALGNGAISGCCGCCDLSQILAVLGAIQAKLVIINNLIVECCDEIRLDFQATWSILANLNVTATVDLNPVFSVIDACCNGTFSTLANLSFTAVVDFSPVFTALNTCCNSTFTALAACCNGTFSMLDKIDREVISTFSVLNTIIINEQGTFTTIAACCNGTFSALAACCNGTFSMLDKIDREVISTFSVLNTIIINEQGTFTTIAACCNGTFSVLANLNLTATADLSGIFTALNTCCNGTFSMLNKIDREVIGTFSVLNTIIINEQGTFTAIAACCNGTFSVLANLNLTATADLSGIFTALNTCCNGTFSMLNKIDNEVIGTFSLLNRIIIDDQGTFSAIAACCNGTFSSLAACCNGTFSVLANLNLTATIDLSGVFTALSACCNGTFSVLANLSSSSTTDLSGVFSTLADIQLTLTACGEIPLFTATQITSTGNFCLARDIVGTITILSNEVFLNLNNRNITAISGQPAIVISGVRDVAVKNGSTNQGGIFVQSSSVITLENIASFNTVTATYSILNTDTIAINNCKSLGSTASSICFVLTVSELIVNNFHVGGRVTGNALFFKDTNNLFINELVGTGVNTVSNNSCILLDSCSSVQINNSSLISTFESGSFVRGTGCLAVNITASKFNVSSWLNPLPKLIVFSGSKSITLQGLTIDENNFQASGFSSIIEFNNASNDCAISNCSIRNNSLGNVGAGGTTQDNFILVNNASCLIAGNNITNNTTLSSQVGNVIAASGPDLAILNNVFDSNSFNTSCTFILITGTAAAVVEGNIISNNQLTAVSPINVIFVGIICEPQAVLRNNAITSNQIIGSVVTGTSFCIYAQGDNTLLEGSQILNNGIANSDVFIAINATGSNDVIRDSLIVGNGHSGGTVTQCIRSTSTGGVIENGEIVGNTSSATSFFDGIFNSGSLYTIRNCLVSANNITSVAGAITGIRDSGTQGVIEANKITNNAATSGSSTGLSSNAGGNGNMIISNESKSHANNYVIGAGAIPLVTISLSTATTTAVTTGTVTCYHNVSTVA